MTTIFPFGRLLNYCGTHLSGLRIGSISGSDAAANEPSREKMREITNQNAPGLLP